MSIGTGTDLGGTGLGGLGVGGSGSGGVDPASEPVGGPLGPHTLAARGARRIQLPRSPKIITGLVMLAVFLMLAIVGPIVAPYDPSASLSTTNGTPQPPSAAHWLGTTQTQQDVFSQLLTGGRSTILVAVLAGVVATVLSVVIGVCAGYLHGHWADDVLSMLANFFLVLPALPLLIVIFGFLPQSSGSNDWLIGLIIAITGWAWGARVLRAQTLSLRYRDYVESARIIGERGWRVISHEILPNLMPVVASSFLFTVLYGVGTYTAIAFLGLVPPEHWSWGVDAVRGAERGRRDQRLLVVVHPARPDGGLPGHRAGPAQLRHRRVHQPAAAGRGPDQAPGQEGARAPRLPKRFELGLTPVVRPTAGRAAAGAADGRPDPGGRHMSGQPLLDIRGLQVDYGIGPGAVHAVVGADLVLRRGEVLGLAGESGSGKSTLAYAAIRLLRAPGMITGGEVLYYPRARARRGPAVPG